MKPNVQTAAVTFFSLFPSVENHPKQRPEYDVESDEEVIMDNLHFAEKVFHQCALMLCPKSHTGIKYFSLNSEHILGHRQETLTQMDIPDFFSLVHPEDLPSVQQCLDFIGSCKPYDPETHRFTMYYRFRKKSGEYIHISDEKLAIKTRNNNYLYFILFNNVSQEEKFYHVKLEVYKKSKGNYLKAYTYNPKQQEKVITPRQNDIVRLIIKGFTNQEIADQLSVSVFTVKNHKQMLFKKVNVKNSIELANYVRLTD